MAEISLQGSPIRTNGELPAVGITARAVLVLDEDNRVLHAERVPEIAREPDYDRALKALGWMEAGS
ncbi:hypothetical protein QVG61_01985 [Thiohalobacter sp. IOR34]|uniref:hypothetical protein n=1 Tax=Thiohalobacter sp. IOR34 TaxID=3057176 RepID=UPI0025AF7772|nr:hypothetical protein [Thiohalobacter sp. IOR34]WJW76875.1 hypothetical protein QVG61_01985 [Thiohalobacter sp. IOR34]